MSPRVSDSRVQGSAIQVLSPEELSAAIRSADLEPCQLSRSPVPSRLARVMLPNACLDFVRLGPSMLFTGVMPREFFTLVFVTKCPEPGHAFTFSIEHVDGYMGLFPPGAELDAHTPEGYSNATLTVPKEMFLDAVRRSVPEMPDRILEDGAGLLTGPVEQSRLRILLSAVQEGVEDATGAFAGLPTRRELEVLLLDAFLAGLRSGVGAMAPQPGIRVTRRMEHLRKARDFIRDSAHEPLRLDDLTSELRMSSRGIEVLFRDSLGIGPSAFIRHQRLHGVRRALLATSAEPGTVKKLALEWGFWHMGHFSQNYRQLFGESPTATLGRGGKSAAN